MESTMTADNKILNIQNKKRIAPITFLYGLCANPVDF